MEQSLFLKAAWGEKVERAPFWMMRQAGRYLPEYRQLRQQVDFLTLCRSPEKAAEATLQPLARFDLDAAIVFSDIMMPLNHMGVTMTFDPGPKLEQPLRQLSQLHALCLPEGQAIAPYVMKAIALLRQQLKVPLIGFAGAPWTLFAYLVEGEGKKDFNTARSFLWAQPAFSQQLLRFLAEAMASYLIAQIKAGAQAVQIFDSWAGLLSAEDYQHFVRPGIEYLLKQLKPYHVPRIYFVNNSRALWPALKELDIEVLGLCWRVSLAEARAYFGEAYVLQGNLDPAVLLADPLTIAQKAKKLRDILSERKHIMNLGHGILPQTPVENVHHLLGALRC